MLGNAETIHSSNGLLVTAARFADLERGFESVKSGAEKSFARLSAETRRKSFACEKNTRGELSEFIFSGTRSVPLSPGDPGLSHFLPSTR